MTDKTIHRFGVPTGLPRTGQVTSYTNYDDGYYEAGLPVGAKARYIDNDDGTITDKATGLMWAKDGNGAGCNNGDTINWVDALSWAEGLTFAGHSDWRLPNLFELFSICLFDAAVARPYINHTYFPNTVSYHYRASNSAPGSTTLGMTVNFKYGQIYSNSKYSGYYVRLVRGGQLNL